MILYTVIIVIIVFIFIMIKKLLITLKIESFNNQFDDIKKVMSQLDDRKQGEKILESADKSINTVNNLQGKDVFKNMNAVDRYINDIIINAILIPNLNLGISETNSEPTIYHSQDTIRSPIIIMPTKAIGNSFV